jgi:hypothetical protein
MFVEIFIVLSPITGFQEVEAPRFLDKVVRLSALPQEICLVRG